MKRDVEKINYNEKTIYKVTYYYDNGIKKSESLYVDNVLKRTFSYDENGIFVESIDYVRVLPTNDVIYEVKNFATGVETQSNLIISDKKKIGTEISKRKTSKNSDYKFINVEIISEIGSSIKTIEATGKTSELDSDTIIENKTICTLKNKDTNEEEKIIYYSNLEKQEESISILKNGFFVKQITKKNGQITISQFNKEQGQMENLHYDEAGLEIVNKNDTLSLTHSKIDPNIIDTLKDSLMYDSYDRIFYGEKTHVEGFKIDPIISNDELSKLFPTPTIEEIKEKEKKDDSLNINNPIAQQKINDLEKSKQELDKRLEKLKVQEKELYQKNNEIVGNPELSLNEREYQKTELEIDLLKIQNDIRVCPRDKKARDFSIEQIKLLLQKNAGKIDAIEYSYLNTMSKSNQQIYICDTEKEYFFYDIEIIKKKIYFEGLKEKQGLINTADRISNQETLQKEITGNEEFLQQQEEKTTKAKETQTRAEIYYKWKRGEISKEEVDAYERNQEENHPKHR